MKLSKEIQNAIVKHVNRDRCVELEAEEIGNELFIEVAREYKEKYGYLPESWEKYMKKAVAYNRYRSLLLAEGVKEEDLEDLSLVELRDMVSQGEYIEERVMTASGGIHVRRTQLKAA